MVFEAHCMSFPCTELLLFNYAKVNTVSHSLAPLMLATVDALANIKTNTFVAVFINLNLLVYKNTTIYC